LAEIKSAIIEPKIAIKKIPVKIINIEIGDVIEVIMGIRKMIAIMDVTIKEYRVDARIIPVKISIKEIGAPNNRSKDFSRVSIGNITGLTAVAVKKEVIATIPTKT
ncbi:MAG: hypothetical protein ACOC4M_05755, partial [Promethearchaeia archaeon]